MSLAEPVLEERCQQARSNASNLRILTDCLVGASLHSRRDAAHALVSRHLVPRHKSFAHHWHHLPPEARIAWPSLTSWHLTTQSHLFRHLRTLWSGDERRIMVDCGCHSGHTQYKNVSDALLWLDLFGSPKGGIVLGVDAVEDFALDLQHRFNDVPPYSSMTQIEKRAVTHAISAEDDRWVRMSAENLLGGCTGSWYTDWNRFEERMTMDHYCRIPRQRRRLGTRRVVARRKSTMSLPPARYTISNGHFRVPTVRVDTLWLRPPINGAVIDFLKIDIDLSWRRMGLDRLLHRRGASVIVLEVDVTWRYDQMFGVSHMDQLVWLAMRSGYEALLKVPCRAARRQSTRSEQWQSTWYHGLRTPHGSISEGVFVPTQHHVPGPSWGIQDLLLVDAVRYPALPRQLHALGRLDCVRPPQMISPFKPSTRAATTKLRATEWLATEAHPGFCDATSDEQQSDCQHGRKGVLGLLPREAGNAVSAARACLARCRECTSCRYISVSTKWADCSWYAHCNLSRLGQSVDGFVSGPGI